MTRDEAIAYFKRHIDLYCVTGICREAEDMAIQALEQEPCEDAISRQAVKEQMIKYGFHAPDMTVTEFVEDLPSVKPQERTGQWIENAPEYQSVDPPYMCSECGNFHLRKTNYCDQCGAKMIEPVMSEKPTGSESEG